MFNFDCITKEDIKEQSKLARTSWPSIETINSWRFWIWKKKNALLNPRNHEPDTDKMF